MAGLPGRSSLPAPLYVIRGARFLLDHRVLWKYAIAPMAISTVVLGLSYYLLYHSFTALIHGIMGDGWYWQVLYYLVVIVAALLLLVVFFFIFTLLASAVAAPFNDLISEKTEQLVTGNFSETPFSFLQLLKDSARGIVHSLRILGIYLALLVVALVLLLIPGFGGPLFTAATVLLSSYMLAYEYLGYPMDRRRFSFREKRAFLRSRFKASMGFGLGNLAAISIPVINLMVIPAAVVGGTLLFLELEPPVQRSVESEHGKP
ncbi:MAG: sulfate transporter CysZ [Deltaproteobacteria bacterium]